MAGLGQGSTAGSNGTIAWSRTRRTPWALCRTKPEGANLRGCTADALRDQTACQAGLRHDTHCNRFDNDLEDGDGSGLQPFYWCPVEEEDCGYAGSLGWVRVPSGCLEPTPIKTLQMRLSAALRIRLRCLRPTKARTSSCVPLQPISALATMA